MIKALFKFDRHIPKDAVVVDTTSNTHPIWKKLSPFVLPALPARNLENLWQFSKVYPSQIDKDGNPTDKWFWWRRDGFYDPVAHRYPMGKGAIPLYSIYPQSYDNRTTAHLDYIDARKKIYIPEYSRNVQTTGSFRKLLELCANCAFFDKIDLVLLDYDAYDHQALGMSLIDVVNNPNKKCGHAFVLLSLLTGEPMV